MSEINCVVNEPLSFEPLALAMRELAIRIGEAIKEFVKSLRRIFTIVLKTIKYALYGVAPPKVRHLAMYHKSERVRKKNWNRMWRILCRTVT